MVSVLSIGDVLAVLHDAIDSAFSRAVAAGV
jgi:hypothetical protein